MCWKCYDCDNRGSFLVHSLAGEGSTSKVYKCIKDSNLCAVQVVKKSKVQGVRSMVANEINTRSFKVPEYMRTLKDWFEDEERVYFVYDYIYGVTFKCLVERLCCARDPPVLPRPLIQLWAYQLLIVLRELISFRCLHRDIKADNLMIELGDIRLIDFAHSTRIPINADNGNVCDAVGTLSYWSPERLMRVKDGGTGDPPLGHAIDIWSVGCVIYFMVFGSLPFQGRTTDETMSNILNYFNGTYEIDFWDLEENMSALKDLICVLLHPDPRERENFVRTDPLNHAFFRYLPRYMPASLDPFDLERSIVKTYGSRRVDGSESDSRSDSMEMTPCVGEAFHGRLWSEDMADLSSASAKATAGHSMVEENGAARESGFLERPQGWTRGEPPQHVLEWREMRRQLVEREVHSVYTFGRNRINWFEELNLRETVDEMIASVLQITSLKNLKIWSACQVRLRSRPRSGCLADEAAPPSCPTPAFFPPTRSSDVPCTTADGPARSSSGTLPLDHFSSAAAAAKTNVSAARPLAAADVQLPQPRDQPHYQKLSAITPSAYANEQYTTNNAPELASNVTTRVSSNSAARNGSRNDSVSTRSFVICRKWQGGGCQKFLSEGEEREDGEWEVIWGYELLFAGDRLLLVSQRAVERHFTKHRNTEVWYLDLLKVQLTGVECSRVSLANADWELQLDFGTATIRKKWLDTFMVQNKNHL